MAKKENRHNKGDLQAFQSLPLDAKIRMSEDRIKAWFGAWWRYDVEDTKTGKRRFVTVCPENPWTYTPKMKETEYVVNATDGQAFVAFSGGKDSTVLLHMVRRLFPDAEGLFVNTGLEFPEIQKFVKSFKNVTIVRPEMRFDEVIKTYGYPVISKGVADCIAGAKKGQQSRINLLNGLDCDGTARKSKFSKLKYKPLLDVDFEISPKCCDVMKKAPSYDFVKRTGKRPIVATMACESMERESAWIQNGCNAFDAKHPQSAPMSFWTEQDVLEYIKRYDLPIAPVYGSVVYANDPTQVRFSEIDENLKEYETAEMARLTTTGAKRTGCIFCAFGCHLDNAGEKGRFQSLKETHPRQYDYCINGGEYVGGVWKPNKSGLGLQHVFDELNELYGDDFIRYK